MCVSSSDGGGGSSRGSSSRGGAAGGMRQAGAQGVYTGGRCTATANARLRRVCAVLRRERGWAAWRGRAHLRSHETPCLRTHDKLPGGRLLLCLRQLTQRVASDDKLAAHVVAQINASHGPRAEAQVQLQPHALASVPVVQHLNLLEAARYRTRGEHLERFARDGRGPDGLDRVTREFDDVATRAGDDADELLEVVADLR